MAKQVLKTGEKILFGIFGVFILLAVVGYIGMETYRLNSDKPIFANLTHYELSALGKHGSLVYREARCNSCHRVMRSGTSMGLSLDGIGSKRDFKWIDSFLSDPESVYGSRTLDHGAAPKEAAYVAQLPAEQRKAIATFLSEIKADAGSSVAKVPPKGKSEFIDNMVRIWAPDDWKHNFQDIREKSEEPQIEPTP